MDQCHEGHMWVQQDGIHQPWTYPPVPTVAEFPPRGGVSEWLMTGGMHDQGRVTRAGLTQQPLPRNFLCQSVSPHMAVFMVQEQPCFTGSVTFTCFQ